MHTFLTPDPITLEIRNAAGDIQILLSDTQTTTVLVTASTSHPLGFLDDVVKAFGGAGRRLDGLGRQFGGRRGPFGEQTPVDDVPGSVRTGPPDLAELVRVEHRADDNPTVIIDTDPARDGWRSAFTITVTAPTGSSIRLQSQSSEVTMTGAAQLVDIRTASGDIRLDETRGRTLAQTASGSVSITTAGAEVDIRSAAGDVQVGPVAGNAVVHTTSGDIRLGAVSGNTDATSVSGDVEIGVPAGSVAAVNLTTLTGSTDTDFEVSGDAPDGDAPVLDITVKTTSGDIRLRRAA